MCRPSTTFSMFKPRLLGSTHLSCLVNLFAFKVSIFIAIKIISSTTTNVLCVRENIFPPDRVPKFANYHFEELLPFDYRAAQPSYRIDEQTHLGASTGGHRETANNKSIYSSLTKIIYQLKNQLERQQQQQLSRRLDVETNVRPTLEPDSQGANSSLSSAESQNALNLTLLHRALSQATKPSTTVRPTYGGVRSVETENTTTITVDSAKHPESDRQSESDTSTKRSAPSQQATTVHEKGVPSVAGGSGSGEHELRDNNQRRQAAASKRPTKASGTRQPRWSTSSPNKQQVRRSQALTLAPKLAQQQPQAQRTTIARLSLHNNNDDSSSSSDKNINNNNIDHEDDDEPSENFANAPEDTLGRGSFGPTNPEPDMRYRTFESTWSSPLHTTSDHESEFYPTTRRYGQKALQLAESPNAMKVGEYFGLSSELADNPQRGLVDEETVGQSDQAARWPRLSPQGIHLERIYPHSSINSILRNQRQSPPPPPPMPTSDQVRPNPRSAQLASPVTPMGANLFSRDLSDQPTSTSSYAAQQQQPPQQVATAASLPQQTQRDLMNTQPQTIQITAVPNNGLVNGVLGGGLGGLNQLLRINTGVGPLGGQLVNGPWNNGLWNTDAFGRPVMMVNAERRQVDWSFWIWPIILVATLPILLGALFVPVFLKTVVILIQILQSLGLLLPLASALSQQVAHATGATTGVAATNQLEHMQKETPST